MRLDALMMSILLLPFCTGNVMAVDMDEAAIDFLEVLEEETDIATKTKMNVDYVPGMVTILHGGELESMGFTNVWQSLALVPGLNLGLSSMGTMKVGFRGLGGVFASSKFKFMVDGMPAYSTLTGTSSAYHIDIAQVERIEVIRGPGSATYGGFATVGVINVIMRKNEGKVFANDGSFNTYQGGLILAEKNTNSAWHINAGGWSTDGANPLTGKDFVSTLGAQAALSNAPGKSNEALKSATINAGFNYKGFSFQALYLDVKKADHFGFKDALPTPDQAGSLKYQDLTLQAKQQWNFSKNTALDIKLQYRNYDLTPSFQVYPAGLNLGGGTLTNGFLSTFHYTEHKYTSGFSISNKSLENHKLLLGVDYNLIYGLDTWQKTNVLPGTVTPATMQTYKGSSNWLEDNMYRSNVGLYLQDQIEFGLATTLTLGVRYDQYSDVENSTNPRVAVVHRLSDRHIFKAQYATAFRPPTFMEMYSKNNPSVIASQTIKAEQSQNYEIGYIYRASTGVARMTLYHTDLTDMIILNSSNQYDNIGKARVRGVELELELNLTDAWLLKSNVSYNNSLNRASHQAIEGSADWLGNMIVNYEPVRGYELMAWGRYVGTRNRSATDTRTDLAADTTVDVSATVRDVIRKGLMLRAGVRNVLNHDVRYPAKVKTYAADYPRAGRSWWSQLSYQF